MAVNLTGIQLSGASIGSASKASSSSPSTKTGSNDAASPQGDVNITSTASLLANLQQSLSAQPAIDQTKVDAISKALAAGTYSVQPDKIASGLLHSERSLAPLPRAEI
jgi:negative regulator of flagellin synthesis FlgM